MIVTCHCFFHPAKKLRSGAIVRFSDNSSFFLYFDPKSYIFPSNSYIFQNAADNNEISRKNHGILV